MRRYVMVLAVLVGALVPLAGLASATTSAAAVKSVSFSGSSAKPRITVTGTGFGAKPPKSYSDASNSCGNYGVKNGDRYGPGGLWFLDRTRTWQAGRGTASRGNCIGLVVTHWSPTKVVFHFGVAYGTTGQWVLNSGDRYILQLKGSKHHGKAAFPAV
jgi:hypothetical protein